MGQQRPDARLFGNQNGTADDILEKTCPLPWATRA